MFIRPRSPAVLLAAALRSRVYLGFLGRLSRATTARETILTARRGISYLYYVAEILFAPYTKEITPDASEWRELAAAAVVRGER